MKFPAQNRNSISIVIVLVLGLSAVYLVPYLVPVQEKFSDSYMFGFNNRTAEFLLVALIVGFALWTRGLGLRLPPAWTKTDSDDRFRRTACVAIAVTSALCALVWAIGWVAAPILEAQHFLDRYAMFAMGARIYRDFWFDYGPLMFYSSVWIAKLCHVSLGNGYFLGWLLQWALGTWALWKIVEIASRGTRHGRWIFLLLWALFIPGIADGGVNYTPLRFCATLAFALGVHFLYVRGASNLATFGFACLGATVMLLYSPEQGIAFTLATVFFFFGVCVRPIRFRLLVALACFTVSMVFTFWLALQLRILSNVVHAAGGVLNFPLLFSFQSLVLLLLLLVAGCVFIQSFRTHASQGPLSYLVCVSLATAPAAFGRADIGHLFVNTLGALIVGLTVLSQYPAIWRWTWPSFVLLIALSTYGKYTWCKSVIEVRFRGRPPIQAQLRDQIHAAVFGSHPSPEVTKVYTVIYKLTHRNAQARLNQLRATLARDPNVKTTHLPPQTHLLAPMGVVRNIALSPNGIQIVTGRYDGFFPVTLSSGVSEKIAEIEAHPDWPLLLPSRGPLLCVSNPNEERRTLRQFLLAPYVPRPRHTVDVGQPFCDYLNAEYIPSSYSSPVLGSFLWVRRSDGARTAGSQ